MTSLAAQLQVVASAGPREERLRGKASLLYELREAADIDLATIYAVGSQGAPPGRSRRPRNPPPRAPARPVPPPPPPLAPAATGTAAPTSPSPFAPPVALRLTSPRSPPSRSPSHPSTRSPRRRILRAVSPRRALRRVRQGALQPLGVGDEPRAPRQGGQREAGRVARGLPPPSLRLLPEPGGDEGAGVPHPPVQDPRLQRRRRRRVRAALPLHPGIRAPRPAVRARRHGLLLPRRGQGDGRGAAQGPARQAMRQRRRVLLIRVRSRGHRRVEQGERARNDPEPSPRRTKGDRLPSEETTVRVPLGPDALSFFFFFFFPSARPPRPMAPSSALETRLGPPPFLPSDEAAIRGVKTNPRRTRTSRAVVHPDTFEREDLSAPRCPRSQRTAQTAMDGGAYWPSLIITTF